MCDRHIGILRVLNRRNVRRVRITDSGVKGRICTTPPSDPVLLLGHWGAGERAEVNVVDIRALERLAWIMELADGEIQFHLLLALPHARLNGQSEDVARWYLAQIATEASQRGIFSSWLDVWWQRWGISEPFGEMSDEVWEDHPLAPLLEARAAKHHRGDRSVRKDAQRYWLMVQVERAAIAKEFPHAIWWTYGATKWEGNSLASLYPLMPRVHLWSLRKGISRTPWFS